MSTSFHITNNTQARKLAEKMEAMYYVEVSATERSNVDLLLDIIYKSKTLEQWQAAREIRNNRIGIYTSPTADSREADKDPLLASSQPSEGRCVIC